MLEATGSSPLFGWTVLPAGAGAISLTKTLGQAWAPDPGSNGQGVAMSNGFQAVLGY